MHTLNDISCIKTDIIEELKHEIRCKGFDNINPYELGQYVDMVKDLSKSEKDCWEKCYYEAVVEAMHDYGFEGEFEIEAEGRMGYDNRRYSNGHYAPKGRGHYSPVHGYTPMHMGHEYRMGYPTSQTGTTKRATMSRMGYMPEYMMDDTHGNHFDDYRMSKRHYTETKDPNEKMKMDHFAKAHTDETVDSIKEIWYDASPETKKDIKSKLSKLVAEMQV